MNYENKYKDALERAREFQKSKDGLCVLTAESIFPELRDSKDERIRKALVRFHKSTIDVDGIKGEDILAWLEKQGEQKNKINSYKITFEDVLVLECAMKTIKITEGGNELYEKLAPLYNKIHNVYLLEKQDEKKVTTIDFNAKDWYVSKVDGKIHNINISSEKQGEKKPINPNAIKDLERAILAAHPTFKQKPTWSEEDERMVEEILDAIEAAEYEMALNMSDVRQWLKNLKQRLS